MGMRNRRWKTGDRINSNEHSEGKLINLRLSKGKRVMMARIKSYDKNIPGDYKHVIPNYTKIYPL